MTQTSGPDALRSRIAAAAYKKYSGSSWELREGDVIRNDWLEIADAVIRELNLHQEIVTEAVTDIRTGSAPNEYTMHRYVTDWKADE